MLDDFEQLKRRVAEVTTKRDKAAGALDQILRRLKKEYGCSTLEEAEALLIKKQDERQKTAETYAAKKAKFEKAWKEKLEGVDGLSKP